MQNQIIRALINGMAWQVTRRMPFWLCVFILFVLYFFGEHR
ncbi:hypothetical protein [Rhizobium bangladeshense]|nr:hypothetical protein [Rhizobium bangladeshense]